MQANAFRTISEPVSKRPSRANAVGVGRVGALGAVVLCLLGLVGCRSKPEPTPSVQSGREGVSPAGIVDPTPVQEIRLLDGLDVCEVRHRGLVLDLGSSATDFQRGFRVGPFEDLSFEDRARERLGVIHTRLFELDFWLDKEAQDLEVAGRFEGVAARSVALSVDGVGGALRSLSADNPMVLRFPVAQKTLARGRHTLTLRFAARRGEEPMARVSWLRVYRAGDQDVTYPAPTRAALIEDTSLAGRAQRAISLRAPGSLRCPTMPRVGVRLRLAAALRGSGTGRGVVSVNLPDGNSVTLWEAELKGAEELTWVPIDVSLDAFAGQEIGLQFSAEGTDGRVLFSEPTLERRVAKPPVVRARTAVVVVAGGMDRRLIPPWGERTGFSNIYSLSEQGVAFDAYRASSSIVTSVAATLVTSVSSSVHGVLSLAGRIPASVPLIAKRLHENGSRSAFFTNVPSTQAAFGFDREWSVYQARSPLDDLPAAAPLLAVADWLRKYPAELPKVRFVLTHVTGGHPPWDAGAEELIALPPKDYEGPIDARRGGVALHEMRARSAAGRRGLSPGDWTRVQALQQLALQKLDLAIGSVVRALEETGEWQDSLFVLMGDIGSGEKPEAPFAPDGALNDGRLSVPLLVKFPRGYRPLPHVKGNVGTESISRTLEEVLGLPGLAPSKAPGLVAVAADADGVEVRPTVSRTMNHYACHLGRYVLRGSFGFEPLLFDLEIDPAAQFDLLKEQPLLAAWMWRTCARELRQSRSGKIPEPEVADIDATTRAALAAYGI